MATQSHTRDGSSSATERFESFVSLGRPTCDVCRDLPADERPADGEFWPETPVVYLNDNATQATEFMMIQVCAHHDTDAPTAATHRIESSAEYVGDAPDRGNSDFRRHAETVEVLE